MQNENFTIDAGLLSSGQFVAFLANHSISQQPSQPPRVEKTGWLWSRLAQTHWKLAALPAGRHGVCQRLGLSEWISMRCKSCIFQSLMNSRHKLKGSTKLLPLAIDTCEGVGKKGQELLHICVYFWAWKWALFGVLWSPYWHFAEKG